MLAGSSFVEYFDYGAAVDIDVPTEFRDVTEDLLALAAMGDREGG